MGAVFAEPLLRGGIDATPAPRAALVAHGGEPPEALDEVATVSLGAEREGLPAATVEHCDVRVTIRVRDGAESLNVAAAAAIALQRICEGAPQAKPMSNPLDGEAVGEADG